MRVRLQHKNMGATTLTEEGGGGREDLDGIIEDEDAEEKEAWVPKFDESAEWAPRCCVYADRIIMGRIHNGWGVYHTFHAALTLNPGPVGVG